MTLTNKSCDLKIFFIQMKCLLPDYSNAKIATYHAQNVNYAGQVAIFWQISVKIYIINWSLNTILAESGKPDMLQLTKKSSQIYAASDNKLKLCVWVFGGTDKTRSVDVGTYYSQTIKTIKHCVLINSNWYEKDNKMSSTVRSMNVQNCH